MITFTLDATQALKKINSLQLGLSGQAKVLYRQNPRLDITGRIGDLSLDKFKENTLFRIATKNNPTGGKSGTGRQESIRAWMLQRISAAPNYFAKFTRQATTTYFIDIGHWFNPGGQIGLPPSQWDGGRGSIQQMAILLNLYQGREPGREYAADWLRAGTGIYSINAAFRGEYVNHLNLITNNNRLLKGSTLADLLDAALAGEAFGDPNEEYQNTTGFSKSGQTSGNARLLQFLAGQLSGEAQHTFLSGDWASIPGLFKFHQGVQSYQWFDLNFQQPHPEDIKAIQIVARFSMAEFTKAINQVK